MPPSGAPQDGFHLLDPAALPGRERYHLLTSLVVPRPIGWLGTYGPDGTPNLAPFSYFAALSADPMQIGVSIGHRRLPEGGRTPKDSLVNVRERGAFTVTVVSEPLLEAMNATSADVAPEVDEFLLAGLEMGRSTVVDAPFVAGAPAVLECRVAQEVALGSASNTLVVGEVVGLRLAASLPREEGGAVDPEALRPVGRLHGGAYALPGPVRILPRPRS